MATHSSILAWRIPWQRSLEGYSPRSRRVRRDQIDLAHSTTFLNQPKKLSSGKNFSCPERESCKSCPERESCKSCNNTKKKKPTQLLSQGWYRSRECHKAINLWDFFFFSFKSAIGGRRVQGLAWFSVLPLWVLKQQQVSGTIFRAVLTLVNNVGV